MSLRRSVNWRGKTYREEDVGKDIIEAMLAEKDPNSSTGPIRDDAHARDRAFMRQTFFGLDNLNEQITGELEKIKRDKGSLDTDQQ